jgi:hypothetical protein
MKQPKAVRPNVGRTFVESRSRLFWPLIVLIVILPLLSWKLASRLINDAPTATDARPGPWGDLDYVRIDIELPEHFIDVDHTNAPEWIFPGYQKEQLAQFFQSVELTTPQLETLLKKTPWELRDEGIVVRPSDEMVWSLSTASRAKIYAALASSPENLNQFTAFSYRPARLADRFRYSGLHDSSIKMFKDLLYPQGSIVRFADVDLVLRKISDKAERIRFVKMLTRRSTLLVKLKVTPESDIQSLIHYWGIGGRAKDLRPLIESLARVPGGCKIDIAHLLPPIPRQRIYTFPYPSSESNDLVEDCHWTAINFFASQPAYFADPSEIAATISAGYNLIGTQRSKAQFGDLVTVKTSENILVHSAVYIADDIVYTKNGSGLNQPWLYMKLEDMLAFYEMPNETLTVEIYRRKQS